MPGWPCIPRIVLVLSMVTMIAQTASAETGIESEADYSAALDRASGGVSVRLIEERSSAAAIDAYPKLIAAYVSIEDALFEAYSPHANRFPAWYAERLLDMGLGEITVPATGAFFETELESGDFDRVVHAYYVLSRSRLPLVTAEIPTGLWMKMVQVARSDPENRYWISLTLAESKMLPFHLYDRLHTKMATRTESVRERIGRNAEALGARIPRILGLSDDDPRVAHPRIRYAKDAAAARVRKHELAALDGPAAYQSMRDELEAMETGDFESRRFLSLMKDDLPVLLETFGLPAEPEALLETLRVLCRGPGSNRMVLWRAADEVIAAYEPLIARAEKPVAPEPLPDAETILSQGAGAIPALEAILRNVERPEPILHLFEAGVIPSVVAVQPPEDAKPLRRAIRDAYYTLGYPPALREEYQRALDSLGPEELVQNEASREKLSALAQLFATAGTAEAFGKAFDELREARAEGRVPSRDEEGSFVTALCDSAVRILAAESSKIRTAEGRAEAARVSRTQASGEIEKAEAAVVNANRLIRVANEAVEREEAHQQAAVATRNDLVGQINDVVERANSLRGGDATERDAARAEARRAEQELNEQIAKHEQEYHEATAALEAAEETAVGELNRARREQARARAAAERENETVERERAAATDAERGRSRFAEVLRRLIAGLAGLGIEGRSDAIGDPGQDASVRIASVAQLLESEQEIPKGVADALETERTGRSSLSTLASIAAARTNETSP